MYMTIGVIMPLKLNQVPSTRRLMGFLIKGDPENNQTISFDGITQSFIWVYPTSNGSNTMSTISVPIFNDSTISAGSVSIPFNPETDTYDAIRGEIIAAENVESLSYLRSGVKIQAPSGKKIIPCLVISETGSTKPTFSVYASDTVDTADGTMIYNRTEGFNNTITIFPGEIPEGKFLTVSAAVGSINILQTSLIVTTNE